MEKSDIEEKGKERRLTKLRISRIFLDAKKLQPFFESHCFLHFPPILIAQRSYKYLIGWLTMLYVLHICRRDL